jgi:hypothetical protein
VCFFGVAHGVGIGQGTQCDAFIADANARRRSPVAAPSFGVKCFGRPPSAAPTTLLDFASGHSKAGTQNCAVAGVREHVTSGVG